MGRDKALIQIDGQPMVDRIGQVLRDAGCVRVSAVGPQSLAGGCDPVDDLHPGEGPLGGILTSLAAQSPEITHVCVVACDLPRLDSATIRGLIDRVTSPEDGPVDVVMAHTDRIEPLCAIWATGSREVLQLAFERGERALHSAMKHLNVALVEVPEDVLRNVNTPDDLPSR
jgi:molybdopterin-guanine dinucleotide biosynthesis protein A